MLGLDDLIRVRVVDVGDIEITLENLEYQLTRSIKKSVAEFQSVDQLFASTPGKIQLTAYITPKTLPENWKDAPAKLKKVVDELVEAVGRQARVPAGGAKGDAQMKDLFQRYGLRPYQDLMTGQVTYFHLLLQVGNRIVRIVPPQNLGEADLKASLIDGLKRAAPGLHARRRAVDAAPGRAAACRQGCAAADAAAADVRIAAPGARRQLRGARRRRSRSRCPRRSRRSCSPGRRTSTRRPPRTSISS